ncbi:MAG: prenyltransferase/squalene oxidase repeat-containing protein [Myxococcota bacterium]
MSTAPASAAHVPTTSPDAANAPEMLESYRRALGYLQTRQQDNGAFAGEVVWNSMLVCQYVIVCHIVGHEMSPQRRANILRSLEVQRQPDGGWGMLPVIHTDDGPQFQGESWLFHTTLCYVALRLLGTPADDPMCAQARAWIEKAGGVYEIPTWGRIWLALLGLYPWEGTQPILPELWLLPESAPMHPRRLYCHMRLIYMGLSYLYGAKYSAPTNPLIDAIRSELYPAGVDPAAFAKATDVIAPSDLYEAPKPALRMAFSALRKADRFVPSRLRAKALEKAMEHMLFEFRSTDYVCLSPVNGFLFCLALHVRDPNHSELPKALAGLEYWVWEDEDRGTRFAGARSDIWDTSFLLQAISEGPDTPEAQDIALRACHWLPTAQMQADVIGGARHYRESAYGGWGFANEKHPWPVSDCTAEAVEALMRIEVAGFSDTVGQLQLGRKLAAVEFILGRQNPDGGFGSYEPRRGPLALKHYNPAEIYGNCMLEYSYTECTGSCVRALAYVERQLGEAMPNDLRVRVRASLTAGKSFLLSQQHEEGGWLGFWGVNVTYGTFFATSGLLAAGLPPSHPTFTRASRWLVEHQRADGGWGESHVGMLEEAPHPLPEDEPSSVVQTAWAVLTLQDIAPHERETIERGLAYLRAMQREDGSWAPEPATGVFFNTSVLEYDLYRQIFPTWAMARALGEG